MRTDNVILQYISFIIMMAICLVVGFYSGMGLLLSFAVPLLITIYSYNNRLRHAIVYVFMSASIAILLSLTLWLFVLFIYGFMGIALGRYLKRNQPAEEIIFKTLIVTVIGLSLLIVSVQLISDGGGLSALSRQTVDSFELPSELIDSFKQAGIAETDSQLLQLEKELKQMLFLLSPSIFISSIFIDIVICYLLSAFVLHKLGAKIKKAPKLSKVTLPGNPIIGTLLVILLAWLAATLFEDIGALIQVNTVFMVLSLFAVQGVAVLADAISYIRFGVVLRYIIFAIVLLANLVLLGLYGLAIIGWLEASFKIRYRLKGRALK